ncbi:MAG: hypothetical protein IPK10_17085 [Bacteroidetes bacterium]|nr:hypothetical protein [Bacteroidota bacterium]
MTKFLKVFSICIILCVSTKHTKAQFVTIPDTNFVNWLNNNGYSSCLINNQLDTTCNAVVTTKNIYMFNVGISDLTGIVFLIA